MIFLTFWNNNQDNSEAESFRRHFSVSCSLPDRSECSLLEPSRADNCRLLDKWF